MPSELDRQRLRHIRENIGYALEWTREMTLAQFVADRRTTYAVIRAMEVVSEASRGLDVETKDRHRHLPWRSIADAGNFYRHEYERVYEHRIWDAVRVDLPPLLAMVETELGPES
jgi:uncharacterized protein with HEPN domain